MKVVDGLTVDDAVNVMQASGLVSSCRSASACNSLMQSLHPISSAFCTRVSGPHLWQAHLKYQESDFHV